MMAVRSVIRHLRIRTPVAGAGVGHDFSGHPATNHQPLGRGAGGRARGPQRQQPSPQLVCLSWRKSEEVESKCSTNSGLGPTDCWSCRAKLLFTQHLGPKWRSGAGRIFTKSLHPTKLAASGFGSQSGSGALEHFF